MNTIQKSFLLLISLYAFTSSSAQTGWNWGENPETAKTQNAIYNDQLKLKHYTEALEPLSWLLTHTPDLHVSLYQNAEKIYRQLAMLESDLDRQNSYIIEGLRSFDHRIKYFGREPFVTDRKASFAYQFYSNQRDKYDYLLGLFAKSLELNQEKMSTGNLVAYMNTLYKKQSYKKEMSDEEVLQIYSDISSALSAKKASVSPEEKIKIDERISQTTKMLSSIIAFDCPLIKTLLAPKIDSEDKSERIKWAKEIFNLSLTYGCTETDLALHSAMIINEETPDYGISWFISQSLIKQGKQVQALEILDVAIGQTPDSVKKAKASLEKAEIHARLGDKNQARVHALLALKFNPEIKSAFSLIGHLYMGSYEQCKGGQSRVLDRSVYLAAYDKFEKAGNHEMMDQVKAHFPSIEDIFNEEYEEGNTVTVPCWINEKVTLRRR